MTTQWQLFPAEGREQKASSSALAETFSSTRLEQKARPDEEDEED